jgi:hypothetical protein
MGCKRTTEFNDLSKKIRDRWINSKTLERYNMNEDPYLFARMFETATGKLFEAGSDINVKDLKKAQIEMDWMISDLKKPGLVSNKYIRYFYIGRAKARKNPYVKAYYERAVAANNFRAKNTQQMTSNYNEMMGALKEAILAFENADVSFSTGDKINSYQAKDLLNPGKIDAKRLANKRIKELDKKEKELFLKIQNEGVAGANNEFEILQKFLDNEGSVFKDFINRVTNNGDQLLREKYNGKNRDIYIDRINEAATAWTRIQEYSRTELVQSLKNLKEVVNLKYGEKTKVSEKLVEEYDKVQKQLENFEGGYIPHYLLTLLGQSLEMRDRMSEITGRNQSSKMDKILTEYISTTKEINSQLLDRMKGKRKENDELFSHNPVLYADKYIKDVIRFNYNTYNDLHFMKGLKELTSIQKKSVGKEGRLDQIGETAEMYKNILTDLHSKATGRGIQDSPTANNIFRVLTALQFTAKLGFSLKAPIKNWTQRLWEYNKWDVGTRGQADKFYESDPYFKLALDNQFSEHGLKFIDISKATQGAINVEQINTAGFNYEKGNLNYRDKVSISDMIANKAGQLTEAAAGKSLLGKKWTFKYVENENRRSTFKTAFFHRYTQLKKLSKYASADAESAPKLFQEMSARAGDYAARWTSIIHFDYNPVGKSNLLATKVGGTVFQFQHFLGSITDLQSRFVKDYVRAARAGDIKGKEAGTIFKSALMYSMGHLATALTDLNFTQFIDNPTLELASGLVAWFNGDEEERKELFYGGGLVSAVGAVPVSDLVDVINLGVAAGYWNQMVDPSSEVGQALGFQDYDKIDDAEFGREILAKGNIEAGRFLTRTVPALFKSDGIGAVRSELSLYGTNEKFFGYKPSKVKKRFLEESGISGYYKDVFGTGLTKESRKRKGQKRYGLTKDQRRKALSSLQGL